MSLNYCQIISGMILCCWIRYQKGTPMAKPNYSFEKRKKELERQKKKEEKKNRRSERNEDGTEKSEETEGEESATEEQSPADSGTRQP